MWIIYPWVTKGHGHFDKLQTHNLLINPRGMKRYLGCNADGINLEGIVSFDYQRDVLSGHYRELPLVY